MNVIPAIDLRAGRVVRLRQGDFAHIRHFEVDAVELARRYHTLGAQLVHVVDLDGAREGHPLQVPTLAALASIGIAVQAGGGVRCREDVEVLFDVGVERVVVGSIALRDPDLMLSMLATFGSERIVVALDMRQSEDGTWRGATDAWQNLSTVDLASLLDGLSVGGLRHALCTDIARDGMAGGPNLDLYAQLVRRWPGIAWIASGGVRDQRDVDVLSTTGVAACVAGTALLDGTLPLAVLAQQATRSVETAASTREGAA